jgi:hypothetical protein
VNPLSGIDFIGASGETRTTDLLITKKQTDYDMGGIVTQRDAIRSQSFDSTQSLRELHSLGFLPQIIHPQAAVYLGGAVLGVSKKILESAELSPILEVHAREAMAQIVEMRIS